MFCYFFWFFLQIIKIYLNLFLLISLRNIFWSLYSRPESSNYKPRVQHLIKKCVFEIHFTSVQLFSNHTFPKYLNIKFNNYLSLFYIAQNMVPTQFTPDYGIKTIWSNTIIWTVQNNSLTRIRLLLKIYIYF